MSALATHARAAWIMSEAMMEEAERASSRVLSSGDAVLTLSYLARAYARAATRMDEEVRKDAALAGDQP